MRLLLLEWDPVNFQTILGEFSQVWSTAADELAELPFYDADIKELFDVHNRVNVRRTYKSRRSKQKNKVTCEMGEKNSTVGERRRKPPNYFVSIPMTNQQILDKIEEIQELLVTKEPKLLPAMIPVGRMHLTIVVAHLNTPAEVEKAVSALQQCKSKVDAILEGKPLILQFQGIGQFKNQVLFAKLSEDTNEKVIATLKAVAESVEILFRELGVNIEDSNEFKPHATFLKLSKSPVLRRKGFRKICPELYKEYEGAVFGTEVFQRIDLCSMHKEKQPSGYYHCESSIDVAGLSGTPHSPSDFPLENVDVARTPAFPEGSAQLVELEMSVKSEDQEEECTDSALHVTEQPASDTTDIEEGVQSPSRSLLPHVTVSQVDQSFTTSFTHVQKEGFDSTHNLIDLKGTLESSLEVPRVMLQNSLEILPSTIREEPEKLSAVSGLSVTQTEMQELKCVVQSGMGQMNRSIQCGFAELNSNIVGLSQNIADLVKILTLIHSCDVVDSSCQTI
ncbi:A-kinase anchor protein 7-like isoform X6 [Chiloscyllium plagiosum]|uniref:A-kinase anchor protein 7-like isoform X6 n=1 Tax=Chiloscyllium plagiosum TaxID=36176 RepID=UPI001CB80E58|nr:A-kinase anchor protein 7-like isoform X6 [Chiloscyllium plagiosum]